MRERLVRLPPDLDDAVQARAADDDRTIAATVRVALRHWLVCPHKVRALPGAVHVPGEGP
jgi:hypothetical protein